MKIFLGVSLLANAILAMPLIFGHYEIAATGGALKSKTHCEILKKDLDFFIEGLTKGNDPFFTPLSVKTMGSLLPSCFPEHASQINASLRDLRQHLFHLVAENTSKDQKRLAHDSALDLFRELRELFGAST